MEKENIDGGAVSTMKQTSSREGDYSEKCTSVSTGTGAWKLHNTTITGTPSGVTKHFNDLHTSKGLHSNFGNGNGLGKDLSSQGRYGPGSFHDRDQRGRSRNKFNDRFLPPKIVAPIVTDKEEDWPTLGSALGLNKSTAQVSGSNGNGLLNGFTKNQKRSSSATNTSSSSSRANSILGQDDQERASVVSGEGENSHETADHVDGDLSTKLRDDCTIKSDTNEKLPKETNNNETENSGRVVGEKKNKTRSGREKLKWKPVDMPNISPNRPLRSRRWEERESSSRNGALNNPQTRIAQSTITTVGTPQEQERTNRGEAQQEQIQSSSTNTNTSTTVATQSSQRGRGSSRPSQVHTEREVHDEESQSGDYYYDDRRRGYNNYNNGGRAYYSGRSRGSGRWHQSHFRGSGPSRSIRHDDGDDGTTTAGLHNSNDEGHRSQDNYHAGNGGNKHSDGGASNSNNNRGGRSGDYHYYRKNQNYTDYPSDYTEIAVSYPYDTTTVVATTSDTLITIPTALTIATSTLMDSTILTTSSSSPNITTTVHQFVMPYSASSHSPLINTTSGGLLGMPTTMEQVVDESRLRAMVKKQIMYYLSEDNLEQDFYLRRQMNPEGYIDIDILASFHRLKGMTRNIRLILEVIISCPDLFELNASCTQVRPRSNPTIWPVAQDDTNINEVSAETAEAYNAEYPPAEYSPVPAPITTIATGENHGHHGTSMSSASSTSSTCVSPGLLKPFRLNPDVAEFVPRNITTATGGKIGPSDST